MRALASIFASLALLALAHCGGTTAGTPSSVDPPAPDASTSDSAAPGTDLGNCGQDNACPTGSTCYWPIGSCTAAGQCIEDPDPNASECKSREELCGCDGSTVTTGCGIPSGYATGSTKGNGGCGTMPTNPDDAGSDDASQQQQLPDASQQQQLPDAATGH